MRPFFVILMTRTRRHRWVRAAETEREVYAPCKYVLSSEVTQQENEPGDVSNCNAVLDFKPRHLCVDRFFAVLHVQWISDVRYVCPFFSARRTNCSRSREMFIIMQCVLVLLPSCNAQEDDFCIGMECFCVVKGRLLASPSHALCRAMLTFRLQRKRRKRIAFKRERPSGKI
jgi:hypothetical protein